MPALSRSSSTTCAAGSTRSRCRKWWWRKRLSYSPPPCLLMVRSVAKQRVSNHRGLCPSFETPATRAPQDEVEFLALLNRREFRHADAVADIVEHHFHRHLADDLVVGHANDVGEKPRTFLQLHQRHHIRHFLLEGRVIDAVEGDEAVDL